MAIIPVALCRAMREAVDFYTRVLDFQLDGAWPAEGDPAFAILKRDGSELHLSSHKGDGVYGQAIAVMTRDADKLWKTFLARGFTPPARPESPVHCGPTLQTWGRARILCRRSQRQYVEVHPALGGSRRDCVPRPRRLCPDKVEPRDAQ